MPKPFSLVFGVVQFKGQGGQFALHSGNTVFWKLPFVMDDGADIAPVCRMGWGMGQEAENKDEANDAKEGSRRQPAYHADLPL